MPKIDLPKVAEFQVWINVSLAWSSNSQVWTSYWDDGISKSQIWGSDIRAYGQFFTSTETLILGPISQNKRTKSKFKFKKSHYVIVPTHESFVEIMC